MPVIPQNLQAVVPVLKGAGFTHAWLYSQDEDGSEVVFMVDERELSKSNPDDIARNVMAVLPGFKVWVAPITEGVKQIAIY